MSLLIHQMVLKDLILTKPLITKGLHLLFISKIVWGGREAHEKNVYMEKLY